MTVTTVDKATGEVLEFPYASYEEMAAQYDEITQKMAALKRAQDKIKDELKTIMGEETKLPLANGWYFRKSFQERKNYNTESVIALLDEDASKYLKVDKSKLDAELKEHSSDGGRWQAVAKQLRDSMEVDMVIEKLQLVKQDKAEIHE